MSSLVPPLPARLPKALPSMAPAALNQRDREAVATAGDGEVRWLPTPLRASDGRLIAGRWAEPPAGQGVRAVAVISPATAVASRFYKAFAEWLALRGYAVLCFDYRGIGDSQASLHPGEDVGMRDWARLDMGAALHAATRRRAIEEHQQGRAVGLLWVGHSFGGNAVGLVPGFEAIDAILGVAAQVAHWRHWSGWARVQAWVFFHVMLPVFATVLAHTPGRVLGPRAQDLPAGASRDWADWGRTPGFIFGDPGLSKELGNHRFTGSVHLWDISDDHLFGPASAVDALALRFPAAQVQRRTVSPADLGVREIAHFGPFRRELGAILWPRLLAPIEAACPKLAAPCEFARSPTGAVRASVEA